MSTAAAKAVSQHAYGRPYREGETLPTTGVSQLRKQRKRRRLAEAAAAAEADAAAAEAAGSGAASSHG